MKIIKTAAAVVATLSLSAGCSPSVSETETWPTDWKPEPQADITQSDLCDDMTVFFRDKLHAVELLPVPLFTPDTDISLSGTCTMTDSVTGRKTGYFTTRRAPDDHNPMGNAKQNFEETTEMGVSVWVYDWREELGNEDDTVAFATRIGEWNSQFEIDQSTVRTESGTFYLTDDHKRSAAQFLIELTRKVIEAQRPPK